MYIYIHNNDGRNPANQLGAAIVKMLNAHAECISNERRLISLALRTEAKRIAKEHPRCRHPQLRIEKDCIYLSNQYRPLGFIKEIRGAIREDGLQLNLTSAV